MFPPMEMEKPTKIMRLGDYAQVLAILGGAASSFKAAGNNDMMLSISNEAEAILKMMTEVRNEPEPTEPQQEEEN